MTSLFRVFRNFKDHKGLLAISQIVRKDAFDAIQTFSFENFDRFRTGRLLVNLSSDVRNVATAT